MDTPEIVTVKIDDVVYRGKGIARMDKQVVFVPATAPGEVVTARIVKKAKNYSEARLIEVVSPARSRIAPACPLTLTAEKGTDPERPVCPGCSYQHINYEEELQLKYRQLSGFLTRSIGTGKSICEQTVAATDPLGYRNKIVLHVAQPPDRPLLGYYGEDNTTVIDVPACPLACAPINELLARLKADPGFVPGLLPARRVTFRCGSDGAALYWAGKPTAGDPPILETTPYGRVSVPRASFYQVNRQVADALVRLIMEFVSDLKPEFVMDLYGGVGIFALAAAAAGAPRVYGADTDRAAVRAATDNARELGLTAAQFMPLSAIDAFARLSREADMSRTLIIVDPPRTGLEKGLVEGICRMKPATVAYISCAADTMARDGHRFVATGYDVTSSRVLDMFPRTPYFESLTIFRRPASRPVAPAAAAGGMEGGQDGTV